MNAEILAVGTELLLGDIVNTNARFLAVELASLGINVLRQSVVGDNPQRLKAAFDEALGRSDIVITTGGLGPTADDITREVVSEAMGLPLMLDLRSFQRIQQYFSRKGTSMPDNNRKQAMLPQGATIFQNDWGTAPACAVEKDGKTVVMLPGPPREMKPIYETYVKPYLAKYSDAMIVSSTVRVFGIGESAVQEKLADLMNGENPTLAPYAKDGEVMLRITARAATEEEARWKMLPMRKEIMARLGDFVYGENVESLQQAVVELLQEKKLRLAVSESCTGGYLAKRITEVPGSSEVFECGIVSYANRVKQNILGVNPKTLEKYGAVSMQTAAEMAEGVRKLDGADIGVGITGVAGPDSSEEKPVGLVFVAVSDGTMCHIRKLALGHGGAADEREYIRYVSASNALDMVRRLAGGMEQADGCVGVKVSGSKKPKRFMAGMAIPDASVPSLIEEASAAGTATAAAPALPLKRGRGARVKKKKEGPWYKRFIRNTFPMKGDTPKQVVYKLLFIVAAIVFAVSAFEIGSYIYSYFGTINLYNNLGNDYGPNNNLRNKDGTLQSFNTLLSENPDTKGHIVITGAGINYPVVQSTDNNFYLRKNFYKQYDRHGIPFIDYTCSVVPKTMSKNIIIFGHNMKDSLMFHNLTDYKDIGFYNKNPLVRFDTIYDYHQWKIFAVFITTADYNYLIPNFNSPADFNNFIVQVRRRSLINTTVDVKPTDHILTLSTCDYVFDNARFVVMARMVRRGESNVVAQGASNPIPLMPDIYYSIYGGVKPIFKDSSATTAATAVSVPAGTNTQSIAAVTAAASSPKAASKASAKPSTAKPGSNNADGGGQTVEPGGSGTGETTSIGFVSGYWPPDLSSSESSSKSSSSKKPSSKPSSKSSSSKSSSGEGSSKSSSLKSSSKSSSSKDESGGGSSSAAKDTGTSDNGSE